MQTKSINEILLSHNDIMPIFGAEMIIFCLKIVVLVGSLLHIYNMLYCCVVNRVYIYSHADLNDVTFLGRFDGNLVGVFIYFILFFFIGLHGK